MKTPPTNSNTQRRAELKRRKDERKAKAASRAATDAREFQMQVRPPAGAALVNTALLKPNRLDRWTNYL